MCQKYKTIRLENLLFKIFSKKSSKKIIRAFLRVMFGNAINLDLYSFLEPFAPILDGEEFTQQQVDAFKVILINFLMQNNFRETILN